MRRKLASRLRELRQEQHLSMEKLGKIVGISSSAIWQWENNLADISSENLIVLAEYFKVSTDYLLGLED